MMKAKQSIFLIYCSIVAAHHCILLGRIISHFFFGTYRKVVSTSVTLLVYYYCTTSNNFIFKIGFFFEICMTWHPPQRNNSLACAWLFCNGQNNQSRVETNVSLNKTVTIALFKNITITALT